MLVATTGQWRASHLASRLENVRGQPRPVRPRPASTAEVMRMVAPLIAHVHLRAQVQLTAMTCIPEGSRENALLQRLRDSHHEV